MTNYCPSAIGSCIIKEFVQMRLLDWGGLVGLNGSCNERDTDFGCDGDGGMVGLWGWVSGFGVVGLFGRGVVGFLGFRGVGSVGIWGTRAE
jgi:hypothetical protein